MVVERYEEIFARFLFREFYLPLKPLPTHAQLKFEIMVLRKCATEADYFRASRIGATLRLNRAMRRTVWALYETAKRHASLEIDMQEDRA